MKKEKPLWMLKNEHDGWCPLYAGEDRRVVQQEASLGLCGLSTRWRDLKRYGYSVVKVKIVEVTK